MDRENLWSRRATTNKPADTKTDTISRSSTSKRFTGSETANSSRPNGISLNTNTASGASAFGLGSGAFASFGSASKTPKTPGSAFEFAKSAATPDAEKQLRAPLKSTQSQTTLKDLTTSSADLKQAWPLKYTWVIWYRPPTSKNSDYEKSIKSMYKMATAQEFWRVYAHLKKPSALPTVSDYHFFKEGIRPVWEDEENKRGGKWILRLKKGVMDRYWDELLLASIGDQFAEAGEEVCGMVVSVRSGEDVLSIWTKNDGGRNVKIRETIKRVLNLPADTIIIWKSHDDSIAQRSAIDQARQDKSTPGRRNTLNENAPLSRKESNAS